MGEIAGINKKQLFTIIITAPLSEADKYHQLLDECPWTWSVEKCIWNKVTQLLIPVSFFPDLAHINQEGIIMAFCKGEYVNHQEALHLEQSYEAHSQLLWLGNNPLLDKRSFEGGVLNIPISTRSECDRSIALGEYIVSLYFIFIFNDTIFEFMSFIKCVHLFFR